MGRPRNEAAHPIMNHNISKLIALPLATLVAAQGCDNEDTSRGDSRAATLAEIEVDEDTVHGIDENGDVVSDAHLSIEGAVSRVEMTFDDGTFTTEVDGATGEVRMYGEIGGESFMWSSLDGESLPAAVEARAEAIGAAWNAALLDDKGELRAEVRDAIVVRHGTADAIGYWDWWSFACGAGMVVACATFTGPAAIGCGLAGAAYCASISY
jgi:hypothetical protein